jgi:signal transduction histidine kinase
MEADRVVVTRPNYSRALDTASLAAEISTLHGDVVPTGSVAEAIDLARRETARDDLIIIYQDNGVGITSEDKPKLFRKGFGKHTGLGLFLAREILAITGSTIMETGFPGKGARFEIIVPPDAFQVTKKMQ